jgi:teichuronic acid biosynthesis glycosyltransferase TuaC
MVRVLSLSTLFPRPDQPGFGRFVARQFEALVERGDIDLTVISPIAKPLYAGPPSKDTSRGYPVHYLPFATIPKFGARWNPALIARAVLPLAQKLHAEKPFDLIDAQFFYPDGPAAARIARELSLPLSIKARGSDINYWGAQGYARQAMLAAAKQAGGMLAVSAALKADMAALGMPDDKIAVHYTGLDHRLFHPRPRTETRAQLITEAGLLIPAAAPLLIAVGNLIPLKGHDYTIQSLTELQSAHLAIAGTGPEADALAKLARELGVSDRVHFLGGVQPDLLARWLTAADVFILPSEREGLANAWIEALACGTPLVISNVGSAYEVVGADSAGLVAGRDYHSIASAIQELLAYPIPQAEVAAHAARFSWEANAAQLAAHYQRLVRA